MAQDFLTDVDAPALLGRLKEAVYRGRIRMSTFFEDHDRLRTGLVTEGKFRTAIEASGIAKLTEMEMRALSAHYADPADARRVRYKDFLVELDSVFTSSAMERDPDSAVPDFISTVSAGTTDAPPRRCHAAPPPPPPLPPLLPPSFPPPSSPRSARPPPLHPSPPRVARSAGAPYRRCDRRRAPSPVARGPRPWAPREALVRRLLQESELADPSRQRHHPAVPERAREARLAGHRGGDGAPREALRWEGAGFRGLRRVCVRGRRGREDLFEARAAVGLRQHPALGLSANPRLGGLARRQGRPAGPRAHRRLSAAAPDGAPLPCPPPTPNPCPDCPMAAALEHKPVRLVAKCRQASTQSARCRHCSRPLARRTRRRHRPTCGQ